MKAIRVALFALAAMTGSTPIASAQAGAPPWTACMTAYQSGAYREALGICNRASNAILPDMKHFKAILQRRPPHSAADQAFALDRGVRVLEVDLVQAKLMRQLGYTQYEGRFSHEVAVWSLNLNALLDQNYPDRKGELYAYYKPVIGSFMQSINDFDPGILQREMAAASQGHR
jgi:hypothetical protein